MSQIAIEPNFLTEEECESIIDSFDRHPNNEHVINVPQTKLSMIQTDLLGHEWVSDRSTSYIEENFGSDNRFDHSLVMRYGEGGYQPLHADAEKQSDDGDWVDNHCPWRSYVGLIYLTTAGQEHGGGDLHLPESDILLAPIRGLFVAFPASHEYVHEVTEVTWGARYGIATWTRND